MAAPQPVVYDVHVLVKAALGGSSDFLTWPRVPATTNNPSADAIGVANDAHDFALWLSPHILQNTRRVLVDAYGVKPEDADLYLDIVEEIADGSGGGVVEPPRTVNASRDFEDNLILDLAAHVEAVLVVSEDIDLQEISPWRGTPIIGARAFSSNVAARRRGTPVPRNQPRTTDALAKPATTTEVQQPFDEPYESASASFELDLQRLRTVVGAWNPHSEAGRERIDTYAKHIETFETRAAALDQLSRSNASEAASRIEGLNAPIVKALDHFDPSRAQHAAKSRLARPVFEPDSPSPTQPELER